NDNLTIIRHMNSDCIKPDSKITWMKIKARRFPHRVDTLRVLK
ncbi:unnamed protein product, partial [Brachionus calyciflorus]